VKTVLLRDLLLQLLTAMTSQNQEFQRFAAVRPRN